jgi:acrylyl-CoA reductase (NADPH)
VGAFTLVFPKGSLPVICRRLSPAAFFGAVNDLPSRFQGGVVPGPLIFYSIINGDRFHRRVAGPCGRKRPGEDAMRIEDFKALVVEQSDSGTEAKIVERTLQNLPKGDLLVRVSYSSLNYKDALAVKGRPGVIRHYPMTPGIDAAGEVVLCDNGLFQPGDRVVITGYDLGTAVPGGYGRYIRVPSSWAVKLPEGLTLRESMALGTAGFTAALAVLKLRQAELKAGCRDVLVTGASGGVGSLAVSMLASEGCRVVAVSGKRERHAFLRKLGAVEVVDREKVFGPPDKGLLPERWCGVVDVVGGRMLAEVLKATSCGGAVASCGLAGSADLPTTVFPFILRGVSLIGIDSVHCPMGLRLRLWSKMAREWKPPLLEEIATECGLGELDDKVDQILAGQLAGRVVVKMGEV